MDWQHELGSLRSEVEHKNVADHTSGAGRGYFKCRKDAGGKRCNRHGAYHLSFVYHVRQPRMSNNATADQKTGIGQKFWSKTAEQHANLSK
jgi:hypothetical protein